MEFDKNKVLTCVTADQARVGQKGWFGETLSSLEKRVEKEPPEVLERIWLSGDRRYIFMTSNDSWSLFYPAPEPTYAERQAQWVKENDVKEGTKVRVTRAFTENEDGSRCLEHDDLVGMTGVVSEYGIGSHYLAVDMSDGSMIAVPYFALEVIKEPTYRPFKTAEEFKPYRDKWLRHGGVIFQHDGYYDCGILIGNERFSWKEMFKSFVFEDGTPYGVKI